MKKKVLMCLPCIVAIFIVAFVGKKTADLNAFAINAVLVENVEALSQQDYTVSIPCSVMKDEVCSFNIQNAVGEKFPATLSDHIKPCVVR